MRIVIFYVYNLVVKDIKLRNINLYGIIKVLGVDFMGFFDIFRKQKTNDLPINNSEERIYNKDDIKMNYTQEGRLVVEFYEQSNDIRQFYDTTKLIIDNKDVDLSGTLVQNCWVSWYGSDDCCYLDPIMKKNERRNRFRNVLAQIDIDLLERDRNYCISVMKKLLNEKRVNEYLEKGLMDNPRIPCGKYVGGIDKVSDTYRKVFDADLGEASHNSSEMINRRREVKLELQRKHKKERAEKEKQYNRLKKELEDDSGR